MKILREVPFEERPRERLQSKGAAHLSDIDLLALLLGSGNRTRDVISLSNDLLPIIDAKWPNLTADDLQGIHGIGNAKAGSILASLEFARRRIRPAGIKVRAPGDILPLVQHLANRSQEHFISISLNGAHEVIESRVVTIGLLNSTQIHPREVFSDAIKDRACAVIVAHNHPSGQLVASEEDKRVTKSLKAAGEILGISLLDHVIFTSAGFLSLKESGFF